MPDGVVQWFDPASGDGVVVRGGRVYSAVASDLEPVARRAGAHVHFDIKRDHGAERAVHVTLRQGTRVSHRQHNYGTLVGAHRPDTKGPAPFAHAHPERGRSLASHPLEVARAWVDCVQSRDLDGALWFYRSDAVLHADGEDHVGRTHLSAYLEASPLFGIERDPDIRGEDGMVLLQWSGVELRCRVEHGMLAEQWVGRAAPPIRNLELEAGVGPVAVTVLSHGGVSADEIDYAVEKVGAVLRDIEVPVLFARIKLNHRGDPARINPAIAHVALDVDGDIIRAHAPGHDMHAAIDSLQRHLRDKLEQRAQHREWIRTWTGEAEPGEWRHGDVGTARPEYFDRPAEERELVRHKTYAIDEVTPDEAAFDMEQLDYDFHLFRDLASGEDSVLERMPDGTYRMTRLHPTGVDAGPVSITLTVVEVPPPELTVQGAKERLDADGERFVFFENSATRRGSVIYRRYDGHYGLVVPA